jgi:prephenate dehydrogenase
VVIGDRPGELARLFAAVQETGVNVEDVSIDHSTGRPSGLVELVVSADKAGLLADRLLAANWTVQRVRPVYASARPGPADPEWDQPARISVPG